MAPDTTVHCPICDSPGQLINDQHPCYQRPEVSSIYACQYCDVQFAWPLRICPAEIYENIYRQAANLPGYDLYVDFAKSVQTQKYPMDLPN